MLLQHRAAEWDNRLCALRAVEIAVAIIVTEASKVKPLTRK